MRQLIFAILSFFLLTIPSLHAQTDTSPYASRIISKIDTSKSGELFLIQEVTVHAPVEDLWHAYSTEEGWRSWSTPLVQMEFKVNGTILSNYNVSGSIGDSTTNTLRIINHVPFRILTLQADISKNWPEFMKEDVDDLYNVNIFEALSDNKSRLTSYGIGYKNTDKYQQLMGFFIKGNEWSFHKLLQYLEEGIAAVWE
ncbi:MAG: SRPBCC domain-containing protein [Bacteroidota bacterium]